MKHLFGFGASSLAARVHPVSLLVLAAMVLLLSPLDFITISPVPFLRNLAGVAGVLMVLWFLWVHKGRLRLTVPAQYLAILFLFVMGVMEFSRPLWTPAWDFVGNPELVRILLLYMAWVQLGILFVFFVDISRDPRSFGLILISLSALAGIFALAAIMGVPGIATMSPAGRLSPFGMNANAAGFLYGIGLVTFVWWLLYRGGRSVWELSIVGSAVFVLFLALVLSGSRGSALAAAVGILVLLVLTFNPRRALLYLALAPIVIVVFGAYLADLVQPMVMRFVAAIEGTSRGARDVIWEVTWGLIKEKPVLGHGLQGSLAIGGILRDGRALAAHNSFLTIGLAFGMVGFLIWLSVLISVGVRLWRIRWHPVGVLFLAICAQLLVSSVFNDFGRDKYFWGLAALAAQAPFWVKYYPQYFSAFVRPTGRKLSRKRVQFGPLRSGGEHH